MNVIFEKKGNICTITINRTEVKNAVDRETAKELAEAFRRFEKDDSLHAAVLCGKGESFCAGADLKALSKDEGNLLEEDLSKDGPMGPTRMSLSKPVIAAVSGYAVAGGLELAIWCDMRVMEKDAVFGVFCRRFGVPLIDGGTQRLPRLIGMSRALDLILTGRPVLAEEALSIGLANRVVESGTAIEEAEEIARSIAAFPQHCLRSDRKAVYRGFDEPFDEAMALEFSLGLDVIRSGETRAGASRFESGEGRHGKFK
ncbi:crotonase/enoyl-CoA hydratase family protein [Bacillus infantis]|uniref:crotonase/enoyl-CoA hydratase family protein n=1 Tax=Bacillus infantis TaxID=324767 RepID=UPI00101C80A9|nr:crotonase/enoyl-CoA hydratase family protein [Bacillus infantis]RYI28815.1 crotonase/enoyl-CoA hydratase family protein [Bacillus infantis]